MKKLLLTFGAVLASIGIYAQVPGMLLRHTEVIGDAMGEQHGVTQWTKSYYDKEGKVIREAVYGLCLDGSIEITRYVTYQYNAQGQLVSKSSQSYGLYDGADLAFKSANDETTYTYDANGNLTFESTEGYEQKEYTYDGEGHLIKKVRSSYDNGSWVTSETTEYSDFIGGKPTKLNNTGRWDSYVYVAELSYDDNGNKVKEIHYNNWSDKKLVGNSFYWTYDAEGFCTLYEKKIINSGSERDYLRSTYKKILTDDNQFRVEEKTQTNTSGEWYNQATSLVREYAKYNHADNAPQAAVDKIGDENRIRVSVTLPAQAATDGDDNAALKVMDNGIILDFLTVAEAKSRGMVSGNTVTFETDILRNGNHEILVQYLTVKGSASKLDDTNTLGWNVSDPVMITLDKQLPAASNVCAVSADKDKNGMYSLVIKWDAAPNADSYKLIRYNVMMKGYAVPENYEDADKCLDLTWTLSNLTGPVSVMIQAVYPYGKANTEYVTFDPKEYYQVADDDRICVEEERTYLEGNNLNVNAGAKVVEKFFVDANDVVIRSAVYNCDLEGNPSLITYNKYSYDGNVLTIASDQTSEVHTRTLNEQGKLATDTYDVMIDGAKYQYVVTYNYSAKDGRLESEVVKRAKYKSNGTPGASSNYSQTIYTNDSEDDGIIHGVVSTYDAMKAKWTEGAHVKRYMMPAKSTYAPTAKALEVNENSVVISAIPQSEHLAGTAAFNIYRNGELIVKGASLLDEEYMKSTDTGDFIDWNYTDTAPEGVTECEYIVQYAILDNYMQYKRAYAVADPFTVTFSGATAIPSVMQNSEFRMQNLYNLAGQRVGNDYRGIVIKNGKKVKK